MEFESLKLPLLKLLPADFDDDDCEEVEEELEDFDEEIEELEEFEDFDDELELEDEELEDDPPFAQTVKVILNIRKKLMKSIINTSL